MSATENNSGWRVLTSSGWLLIPKTVSAVLSLVYLALATQTLGPAGFGKFMLMFSFAQTVSGFSAFQTWQVLIRYGTALVQHPDNGRMAQLTWFCLMLDLAAILLAFLLSSIGLHFLAINQGWNDTEKWLLIGFTVLLVLASRSTSTGILRVYDHFRIASIPDSMVPVIRLIGTLVVIFTEPSITGFLLVWLLSELIPAFFIWILVFRYVAMPLNLRNLLALRDYKVRFPKIIEFALWSNLGSSLKLTSQHMVAVVVGFFAGATVTGFFRLGSQLGQVIARFSDALSLSLFTEYARVAHSGTSERANALLFGVLKTSIAGATIMIAIVAFAGEPLIALLFGKPFAPAYHFVLLLGGAAAIQFAAITVEPALLTAGHAGQVLLCSLVGAVTIVLLLALLLPRYGAIGAAFAVLGASIANVLALIYSFRRYKQAAVSSSA